MKKIVLTLLVVLAFGWTSQAQERNCRAVLYPLYILEGVDSTYLPEDKAEDYCDFSRCAFFITNEVPSDAIVHNITELTDRITGKKVPDGFVADLNTISYWGYDYDTFRPRRYEQPIYFRMGSGKNVQYLGVRGYRETMSRHTYPEQFKD